MATLLVHLVSDHHHHRHRHRRRRRRCCHVKAVEADFAVHKDLGLVGGKVDNAIQLINAMDNAMVFPVLIR